MSSYISLVQGIGNLFNPFAEVVLHDLKTNKIICIHNAFSKRKVGDSSYLEKDWDWTHMKLEEVLYEKVNFDGRLVKSVSIPLPSTIGEPQELLCINFDVSFFSQFKPIVDMILEQAQYGPKPDVLFKDDLDHRLHAYIQVYLKRNNLTFGTLKRDHKRAIIQELHHKKAFDHKNAAKAIGRILDLSRATIYNYLKETY